MAGDERSTTELLGEAKKLQAASKFSTARTKATQSYTRINNSLHCLSHDSSAPPSDDLPKRPVSTRSGFRNGGLSKLSASSSSTGPTTEETKSQIDTDGQLPASSPSPSLPLTTTSEATILLGEMDDLRNDESGDFTGGDDFPSAPRPQASPRNMEGKSQRKSVQFPKEAANRAQKVLQPISLTSDHKHRSRSKQANEDVVNFDAEFATLPSVQYEASEEVPGLFDAFTFAPELGGALPALSLPTGLPGLSQPFAPELQYALAQRPMSHSPPSPAKPSLPRGRLQDRPPPSMRSPLPPPPPAVASPLATTSASTTTPVFAQTISLVSNGITEYPLASDGPIGGKKHSPGMSMPYKKRRVAREEAKAPSAPEPVQKSAELVPSVFPGSAQPTPSYYSSASPWSAAASAPSYPSDPTHSGHVARDKQATDLESDIELVSDVSRDLHALVQEQHSSIDNIALNNESNITTGSTQVNHAVMELQAAELASSGFYISGGLSAVGSAVGGFFSGFGQLSKKSEPQYLHSQLEELSPSAVPTIAYNTEPSSGERCRSIASSRASPIVAHAEQVTNNWIENERMSGALGGERSGGGKGGGFGDGQSSSVDARRTRSADDGRISDSAQRGIGDNRLKRLQSEVDEVREALSQNIEQVLCRGDRIDSLMDHTEDLHTVSFQFKKNSSILKRRMWFRYLMTVLLVFVLPALCGALYGACWYFDLSISSVLWLILRLVAPVALTWGLLFPLDVVGWMKDNLRSSAIAFLLLWLYPFLLCQSTYYFWAFEPHSWARDVALPSWLFFGILPLGYVLHQSHELKKGGVGELSIATSVAIVVNALISGLFYGAHYFGCASWFMLLLPSAVSMTLDLILGDKTVRDGTISFGAPMFGGILLLKGFQFAGDYFFSSPWITLLLTVIPIAYIVLLIVANSHQRRLLVLSAIGMCITGVELFALSRFAERYLWPFWESILVGTMCVALLVLFSIGTPVYRTLSVFTSVLLVLGFFAFYLGDVLFGFPLITALSTVVVTILSVIMVGASRRSRERVIVGIISLGGISASCGVLYGLYLLFFIVLPDIAWTIVVAFASTIGLLAWVASYTKASLPTGSPSSDDASPFHKSLSNGYQQQSISRPDIHREAPLNLEVPIQDYLNIPGTASPDSLVLETSDLSAIPAVNTPMMNQYDLVQYDRPRFAYISSTPEGSDRRIMSFSIDWKTLPLSVASIELAKSQYESLHRSSWSADGTTHISSVFQIASALLASPSSDPTLATTVLSNLTEGHLGKVQLLRAVAYKLEERELFEDAAHLYRRILELRGEEPQSYRDLALVLSRLAKHEESFSLFDKLLTRCKPDWDARFSQVEVVSLMDLCGILPHLNQMEFIASGFKLPYSIVPAAANPLQVDLRAVLTWDVDGLDVELQVLEPHGEILNSFTNQSTRGGMLSREFTGGYGPVEYLTKRCLTGAYCLRAVIRSPCVKPILGGEATLRCHIFTNYASPCLQSQETRVFRITPTRGMTIDLASVRAQEVPK